MPEEFHSRFRRLVRLDRRVGHTRSAIDANMQIFPAGATAIYLPGSRLSVSHAADPAQTRDIQMRYLPGLFPRVTPCRMFYLQRAKP